MRNLLSLIVAISARPARAVKTFAGPLGRSEATPAAPAFVAHWATGPCGPLGPWLTWLTWLSLDKSDLSPCIFAAYSMVGPHGPRMAHVAHPWSTVAQKSPAIRPLGGSRTTGSPCRAPVRNSDKGRPNLCQLPARWSSPTGGIPSKLRGPVYRGSASVTEVAMVSFASMLFASNRLTCASGGTLMSGIPLST